MGALKDKLRTDLAAALRAGDETAKDTIRLTLAAITKEEVAGKTSRELTDAEELAVIRKEVNQRRDSAESYAAGGRQDLAAKENTEAEWLARYLPADLTEEDLQAIVAEEVAAVSDATMRDMGRIIKAVNARTEGRAQGKTVAALVRAALNG